MADALPDISTWCLHICWRGWLHSCLVFNVLLHVYMLVFMSWQHEWRHLGARADMGAQERGYGFM